MKSARWLAMAILASPTAARRLALPVALALLATACAPEEDPLVPAVRFVDPQWREGITVEPRSLEIRLRPRLFDTRPPMGLRTETIGTETRPVLAAPARGTPVPIRTVDVSAGGRVSLSVPIEPALRSSGRVVLLPSVRTANGWSQLAPSLVTPDADGPFRLELRIPAELLAQRAALPVVIRAVGASPNRTTHYTTPVVTIGPDTALRFSYGLLNSDPAQSRSRFSISLCDGDECDELFANELDPARDGQRWHEASVDLTRHAGTRRQFRFRTERSDPAADAHSMPVWGDPKLLSVPPEPVRRPNLILISVDTLRADHLGLYGYARDTSPNLDRWAAERAAVFDAFTAASTHTGPSHMTLFTSLPPSVHGVQGHFSPLRARVSTLPELLRASGYATAAFTGGGPLHPRIGFGRGFDVYRVDPEANRAGASQAERMVERAQDWLTAQRQRPAFLFLHTFQAHTPYAPPERYRSRFEAEERADLETAQTPLAQRTAQHRANYDREIRHVDDVLGDLFDWLDREGFTNDTIVVLLSDHGEEFREHGLMGHATLPFQSVLHVPLIIAGPGIAAQRIEEPIDHASLLPTLLELLEIEPSDPTRGYSFAPRLRGPSGPRAARALVSEAWELPDGFEAPSLAIRVGRNKLIRARSGAGEQSVLFDLSTDPGEQQPNVRGDEADRLRAALTAYERDVKQLTQRLRETADDAPVAPPPEAEQRLRELGYIE
jgi:arylsulfatase A-like enzyme